MARPPRPWHRRLRRQANDAAAAGQDRGEASPAVSRQPLPPLIFPFPSIPSERGESRELNTSLNTPVAHLLATQPSSAAANQLRILHRTGEEKDQGKREREGEREEMADQPPVSPIRNEESATTREEMDFDDNEADLHDQETGTVSPLGHETPTKPPPASTTQTQPAPPPIRKTVSFQEEEAPPPKPPRPLSPQQQAENTLIEAFPSIDTKVVKAVLVASGGQVEPAFNALLGMSDPDFAAQAPPPPPRPAQRAPMTQMEADEMYARQLAEQYNSPTGGAPRAQNRYNQREPGRRAPNQQPRPYQDEDQERNFFDDDLPEIGRNIQQGFLDTQKKVNSWISNFKKRIDGQDSEHDSDDDEEDLYSASQPSSRQNTAGTTGTRRQNFGPSQSEQLYGIQKQAEAQQRRSAEALRYDADPHELGEEEFERLELRDDEALQNSPPPPMPPRTSSRKQPNPDLFKSSTTKPPQSGPVDEVEAAGDQTPGGGSSSDPKAKKWQPLTSVAPHPEEDNDPFSLGDDDEDKDKGTDLRSADSERLKEAARNSISAGAGAGGGEGLAPVRTLEETGRSGSQNQEAVELLSGTGKKE